MELLRMFYRTTIFCHQHWAREGDQMLCVEPASATAAAAMDAGKKQCFPELLSRISCGHPVVEGMSHRQP